MNTINNTRVPRPIGSTEQSKLYNRTLDDQYHQQLYRTIIHHYIRNNFSYCGIYYNIEEFSKLIKVQENDIMKYITSYGNELTKLNKEMLGGDTIMAVVNLSINWGLEDRSQISQQLAILQSSQGTTYAPFISGEVTKAIKTKMDNTAMMHSLMRSLMPSGNETFVPLGDQGNTPSENVMTVDKAVLLLKQEKVTPLLQDDDHKAYLKAKYLGNNVPEVNALKQINMDTSKEGLGLNKVTEINEAQLINHSNRREAEFEIDPESDEI